MFEAYQVWPVEFEKSTPYTGLHNQSSQPTEIEPEGGPIGQNESMRQLSQIIAFVPAIEPSALAIPGG
jgi:hypothetical protein